MKVYYFPVTYDSSRSPIWFHIEACVKELYIFGRTVVNFIDIYFLIRFVVGMLEVTA